MEIFDRGGEVEVAGVVDFDPVKIFECGQCFRWDADENGVYTGVARGRIARLRKEGGSVYITSTLEDFDTVWRDYFDLGRDYEEVRRKLCIDDYMREATAFGAGIRILRQDRWEALCSFIVSQCNNIPRIKKIISGLCRLYGDEFVFEGKTYNTFPPPSRLAALRAEDLAPIRCGYRDGYIINAARAVDSGELDLEALSRLTPETARNSLKILRGVGNKVADCALLFGFNMLNAFPVDVWMRRAVAEQYGPSFDPRMFSPYAGIAQQYIFYYARAREH